MTALPSLPKCFECIDICTDGSVVLLASNQTTRVWSSMICCFNKVPDGVLDSTQYAGIVNLNTTASCLKVIPHTKKFLCGCDTGAVMLWELYSNENGVGLSCLAEPEEHDNFVSALSLNSSCQRAISASEDRRIKIWDVEELTSVRTLLGHSMGILSADYHPTDAEIFASCAKDAQLILWDTRLSVPGQIIPQNTSLSSPTSVHWLRSKDNTLAVGRENGTLTLHDRRCMQTPLASVVAHKRTVARLACSPNGRLLATSGEDCSITVLDLTTPTPVQIYRSDSHTDFAYGLCWLPQSERNELVTCGWDTRVLTHIIPTGAPSLNVTVTDNKGETALVSSMDTT